MNWDFWPLIKINTEHLPTTYTKHVRYADGKWNYEADTEQGITIKMKCSCGQEHTLKLDRTMVVQMAEEIMDAEEIKDEHTTSDASTES